MAEVHASADSEVKLTDPAREIVQLLNGLRQGETHLPGGEFLGQHFDVEPWTPDFYRILTAIIERIDELRSLVRLVQIDDDHQSDLLAAIDEIQLAFSHSGFAHPWVNFGLNQISQTNIALLRGLSPPLRQVFSYRRISDDERIELIDMVAQLSSWLKERQLSEQDFLREALLTGLASLEFRLSMFPFFGHRYTLQSLQDTVAAYMALERNFPDLKNNPDAEAVLNKTETVIKDVYAKLRSAKELWEISDWLLKVYGATTLAITTARPVIALLTGP
ncbi:hypothetical protein [Paracoccus endophyticus]|uniref:hypothetical protein n=1 Tax=Paracoccus endophyticus TaxID=2233774 RepID=UPI0013A6E771|nr:hypothetical protein [Paracoccus endophyticus]